MPDAHAPVISVSDGKPVPTCTQLWHDQPASSCEVSDMTHTVSRKALRLGLGSAMLLVALECLYAVALILGLNALPGPEAPISDPYFTALEVLILLIAPMMVLMTNAILCACTLARRVFAVAALVFAGIAAALTSMVHASVLLLSRTPPFDEMPHIFAFEWPSVVYVLDILAWDFFFALFAVSLAFAFGLRRLEGWIRAILLLSGLLAFAGLWGAVSGDMQLRNIGILGYVPIFTLAVALIAVHFSRRLRELGE